MSGFDHGLGVAVGRQNADAIDRGGDQNADGQRLETAIRQIVDHRPDHIGAQQIGQGADGDQEAPLEGEACAVPCRRARDAQGIAADSWGFLALCCRAAIFIPSFHLGRVDFLVNGVARQQLFMRADSVYLAVVQNDNLVCVHD